MKVRVVLALSAVATLLIATIAVKTHLIPTTNAKSAKPQRGIASVTDDTEINEETETQADSTDDSSPASAAEQTLQPFEIPDGPNALSHDIVLGGTLATEESRVGRFTVMMDMYKGSGERSGSCTGIVVSRDLILSAGHCFKSDTASVKIKFGLGGEHGFETEMESRSFRWSFDHPETPSTSPWRNGYLPFEQEYHENLLEAIRNDPTYYPNYHSAEHPEENAFLDLALIKLPRNVPSGFSPIRFYVGSLDGHRVYAAGYGLNSRIRDRNVAALRFARQRVMAHYTEPGLDTTALGFMSTSNQNICYGDSGGPFVIETDDRGFELLGIIVLMYDNCASEAWAALASHSRFRSIILGWARELRSTIEL